MIDPYDLEEQLAKTLGAQRALGFLTWQRVQDWVKEDRTYGDSNRGGGVGNAKTDDRLREQLDDEQASMYFPELNQLSRRLDADLRRLRRIIAIANPVSPKAQPDAGCRSCFRDGGTYEPVHAGRYRNACRFCGEWRAEHGDWPPLTVIRWRHRHPGKRVPLTIVEKAG